MREDMQSFATLYNYLIALPENDTFLNHIESDGWKTYSKSEFLEQVHYLTLAFESKGWRGKQIALVIEPSIYWLLIDYALMLSGGVSVPLFTNISIKNLRFQISDADIHTVFTQTNEQENIIREADSSISCFNVDCTESTCHSLDSFIMIAQKLPSQKYFKLRCRYSSLKSIKN